MSREAEAARFEQLVRDTRADLLAYALRRAASPEDAADVISETYLIAWRKLDRIPPGDRARLWLFGVAANVLRRGAERHRSSEALIERLRREPFSEEGRDRAVEPEAGSTRALRAALMSLSPADREILTLTAWEGLTPKQIGAVMGLSTGVVRVRLHRARARLRRRLGDARRPAPDPDAMIANGGR